MNMTDSLGACDGYGRTGEPLSSAMELAARVPVEAALRRNHRK